MNALKESIYYGSTTIASVEGLKAVEKVCLLGQANPNGGQVSLCLPKKTIVAADQIVGLKQMKADGVLGLSPVGSDSLLQELIADRQISNKVFSFSLEHNVFTLGGYD